MYGYQHGSFAVFEEYETETIVNGVPSSITVRPALPCPKRIYFGLHPVLQNMENF